MQEVYLNKLILFRSELFVMLKFDVLHDRHVYILCVEWPWNVAIDSQSEVVNPASMKNVRPLFYHLPRDLTLMRLRIIGQFIIRILFGSHMHVSFDAFLIKCTHISINFPELDNIVSDKCISEKTFLTKDTKLF